MSACGECQKRPHGDCNDHGPPYRSSSELTEAAYCLPLQAKRVLCLMQCYPVKDDPDSVSPVFTVTVADYQKFFKVSVDTVKKGVTTLASSSVVF